MKDLELISKVAMAMRAEMGRIDKNPARPWHDADERNKKIWRKLAEVAIDTILPNSGETIMTVTKSDRL